MASIIWLSFTSLYGAIAHHLSYPRTVILSIRISSLLLILMPACLPQKKKYYSCRVSMQSRVSKEQDVWGQIGTGRFVVPLSQDKNISLFRCPFVPG